MGSPLRVEAIELMEAPRRMLDALQGELRNLDLVHKSPPVFWPY